MLSKQRTNAITQRGTEVLLLLLKYDVTAILLFSVRVPFNFDFTVRFNYSSYIKHNW